MKKLKNNKGITLVALIITIIVLLILSVVAINEMQDGGVIAHAKNAQQEYKKAAKDEELMLSHYSDYLKLEGNIGPWSEKDNGILSMKDKNGEEVKVQIGDLVNYNPIEKVDTNKLTYTSEVNKSGATETQIFNVTDVKEWQVLGCENGKLLLVATTSIFPVRESGVNYYSLVGKEGYNNGESELNKISAIYGHGKGAESARSINANDIKKIAGITEANVTNYGTKNTYYYDKDSNNVMYTTNNNNTPQRVSSTKNVTAIYFADGTVVNENNPGPKEITCTFEFYIDTLLGRVKEYNSIVNNLNNGGTFWTASRYVLLRESSGDFQYGFLVGSKLTNNLDVGFLQCLNSVQKSYDYSGDFLLGVRPIVTLKADTELIKNGIQWNIK